MKKLHLTPLLKIACGIILILSLLFVYATHSKVEGKAEWIEKKLLPEHYNP